MIFIERIRYKYYKEFLTMSKYYSINEFSAASTGTSGSMYNVSMDKFKSIKIPVAPIELQNQFADFVRAVDKSKVITITTLKKLTFIRNICYNNSKDF